MPELFDIDRAFDDLLDDVGARTRPLGADRVAAAGRRRRTTRIAGGALVLLVGGGAALWPYQGHDHVVDAAGSLPAPHAITAEVLDEVTAGWVADWVVPTDPKQLERASGDDLTTAGDNCLESLINDNGLGDDDLGSGPTGSSLFVSGMSLALSQAGKAGSEDVARRLLHGGSLSDTCRNVQRSAPNDDTDLITATASDSHGHAVFAAVRWHDRFAVMVVSSPATGESPRVQDAIGTALLAAIQDDTTVTKMSPVLKAMRDGLGAESVTVQQSAPRRVRSGSR